MRVGGSYTVEKPGAEPVRVAGTEEHPGGNRARDADGNPVDKDGNPIAGPAPRPDRPRTARPAPAPAPAETKGEK